MKTWTYYSRRKRSIVIQGCAVGIFVGLALLVGSVFLPVGDLQQIISISGIVIAGSAALVIDMAGTK